MRHSPYPAFVSPHRSDSGTRGKTDIRDNIAPFPIGWRFPSAPSRSDSQRPFSHRARSHPGSHLIIKNRFRFTRDKTINGTGTIHFGSRCLNCTGMFPWLSLPGSSLRGSSFLSAVCRNRHPCKACRKSPVRMPLMLPVF